MRKLVRFIMIVYLGGSAGIKMEKKLFLLERNPILLLLSHILKIKKRRKKRKLQRKISLSIIKMKNFFIKKILERH